MPLKAVDFLTGTEERVEVGPFSLLLRPERPAFRFKGMLLLADLDATSASPSKSQWTAKMDPLAFLDMFWNLL